MTVNRTEACYAELPLGTLDPERIEAVWRYRPLASGRQRVLPDGRMDLVVHCAAGPADEATPVLLVIAGPAETPTEVVLRPQTVIFGVRFRIGWGGVCLGIAPGALRNRTVSGREVDQCLGPLAAEILQQRTVQGVEDALRRVAGVLASRAPVAVSHGRALDAMGHMVDWVRDGGGDPPPGALPSARTLRRDMAAAVGLPLRTLAGILRFQRAMALLVAGAASLSDVAVAAGYADQAHMTREFRRFGGFTPALPVAAPLVRLSPQPA
jgi:hypothetical protein